MQTSARLSAAIEVLDAIMTQHRPAADALSEWGRAHRFAGSGDRNAIGTLVYDALRKRGSSAWRFQSDGARTLALGAVGEAFTLSADQVIALCEGGAHAPTPLSEAERQALVRNVAEAPAHVQADLPQWLWPAFESQFGPRAAAEGTALAKRAPTDIRINSLKANHEKVAKALRGFEVTELPFGLGGLRVPAPQGTARTANLQAEAAFQAGWFEIQDAGSQVAAALCGAGPRTQVLDLCAGAGGKTLSLGAAMQNKGQIYAYDGDRLRLKPIFARLKRAGVRNVQVLRARDQEALAALGDRFDVVLVDAPCTGTGVWRRRPEAKWRLKAESVAHRQDEQRQVLELGKAHVKPGGRLIYVTCSILPEENTGQIADFLTANPNFKAVPFADAWRKSLPGEPPLSADGRTDSLLLTPQSHSTDGFFISLLERGG